MACKWTKNLKLDETICMQKETFYFPYIESSYFQKILKGVLITYFYIHHIVRNLNPIQFLIGARPTTRSFPVILLFHLHNGCVTWVINIIICIVCE